MPGVRAPGRVPPPAGWVALEVIMPEKEIKKTIPALKRAGAEGIIEYPLNKIIY